MSIFIRLEFLIIYSIALIAISYITGRIHGKKKHKPSKEKYARHKD